MLTQLGLMAHLCGALTNAAPAAKPVRTAALAAITSLCSHQSQSQINFFQYGGVNTLLQTLLQAERSDDEVLAALTLLERVLAPIPDCRDIMDSARGMEVLAQVCCYSSCHSRHLYAGSAEYSWKLANKVIVADVRHVEALKLFEQRAGAS